MGSKKVTPYSSSPMRPSLSPPPRRCSRDPAPAPEAEWAAVTANASWLPAALGAKSGESPRPSSESSSSRCFALRFEKESERFTVPATLAAFEPADAAAAFMSGVVWAPLDASGQTR